MILHLQNNGTISYFDTVTGTLSFGGAGSGRYPAGSGGDKEPKSGRSSKLGEGGKVAPEVGQRAADWKGMNWIRQDARLGIYLRDGQACAYCGHGLEQGAHLTLDHIVPHSHGGTNSPKNLVTCCQKCNSVRGNRPVEEFAKSTAAYIGHGLKSQDILNHIAKCTGTDLSSHRDHAKALIAQRGSAAKVITHLFEASQANT